ncbi:dTDP-4-amino-4,6-dideoxygalactose transaminase [uncultured Marinobacter sp.]|uniref:dTDP-4-amino-4,6-dideoxygalactose transaminase n=1 Tax=uncultured Marinobacter sp. TaxID=187379 RepID=UPI00344B26E1
MDIRFNFPHQVGTELECIRDALEQGVLAGDGPYTKNSSEWLEGYLGASKVLLTHSCTAALEMAAILADIKPGDEVIMPSYTFVSTANAFVLRGGVPVFVDIREDTLNIDEELIESAITSKTKAIVPVHYAGVSCEMDKIMDIAKRHNLIVIEDAAQALGSYYKGRSLGTIGDFGCFSFHETKNIISGEGGAIVVNNETFIERAEIIREKGTNRTRFFRGEVDKYTWVDIGSSFLPSELVAAFLYPQLQHIDQINDERMCIWNGYHDALKEVSFTHNVRRPVIPKDCVFNAHLYYLIVPEPELQQKMLSDLKRSGINAVFHYVPLHSSEAGKKFCRLGSSMSVTDALSSKLVRLPIYPGLTDSQRSFIQSTAKSIIQDF